MASSDGNKRKEIYDYFPFLFWKMLSHHLFGKSGVTAKKRWGAIVKWTNRPYKNTLAPPETAEPK